MESGTPSRLSFQNLLRSFKKSLEQNTRNQTQADDSLHIPNNMPIEAMKAKSPMGALHSVAEPLDNNSALKIQILSDLHLEVRRYTEDTLYHYNFPATAPHLALLGDIGCTQDPRLFDWLDLQLTRFKLIFYIAGNHEPYDSSLEESTTLLEEYSKKNAEETDNSRGRFIFLNRTRYDVSDTLTILGCTLWSALEPDPSKREYLALGLNDFKRIENFDPDRFVAAHRKDLEWLSTSIMDIRQKEPGKRIVIFTHHAPTIEDTMDPKYYNGPSLSAFATELTETEWWGEPMILWAFGHTHYSCDFHRNSVRVYSNQRGNRHGDEGYAADEIVEI